MILAQGFASFVLDLDGVVWRGEHAIPGSPETVRALREAGKRVVFMTNNSWRTPAEVAEKLHRLGAPSDAHDIVTSAVATQELIRDEVPAPKGRTAYVIGGAGLISAMEEVGLRLVDGAEAEDASVVIVGIDRELTYEKLRLATLAIRAGAMFFATNTDPTLPVADGLWPGAGAIVAALKTAGGVAPRVAGKPNPPMIQVASERLADGPALVVGDRVDTDVLAAAAVGWPSALTLSGATGLAELAVADAWPDYILRDLSHLLRDLPHPSVRQASGPDLPAIATLLHEAGLPAGSARERLGRTVVAEVERGKVLATAAWEPVGGFALLRSIATTAGERGLGLGTHVVAATLRSAARAAIRDVYLVTPDAEQFFKACGFRVVARDELPADVAKHPQVTRECPSTSPVMRMTLPDHA